MQRFFLKYRILEYPLLDGRLTVRHLSLYMALVYCHEKGGFCNPVWIQRGEVMKLSRIQSRQTFYQCLKDLSSFGYISYLPSYDHVSGGLVYLRKWTRREVP